MTQCLLFCDVLWTVNWGPFPVPHDGTLVDDLSTDSGDSGPSKEGGVVRWVLEADVMEQGTAGDVNVGVGVGDFLVLGEDPRGDLSKGPNDFEILIVRTEFFAKVELNGGSGVLRSEYSMTKAKHGALGRELTANESFDLVGVAGADAKNKFEAGLIGSSVKRP